MTALGKHGRELVPGEVPLPEPLGSAQQGRQRQSSPDLFERPRRPLLGQAGAGDQQPGRGQVDPGGPGTRIGPVDHHRPVLRQDHDESSPKQLFTVTAITHRDRAVMPAVAAGPPVEEDHTIIGTTSAAEILHLVRRAGLPVSSAWYPFEAAVHWLVLALPGDWHETTELTARDLADRVAEVVFAGKPGVNAPKIMLVEDDIDITDLEHVMWAFATRCHPDVDRGTFHYANKVSDQLAVYLSPEEQHTFLAGKVIYNCLLADLYPEQRRPVKGSFENGWPAATQQKVVSEWHSYGYR